MQWPHIQWLGQRDGNEGQGARLIVSSKNERLDITMRLLGARQVERESEKAGKGIKGVGTAARSSTGHHEKLHRATSTLTKSYGQLGKATRYGIGFLGVGGLFALKSSITGTEELAKSTSAFNRNLGLSVKTSSEWASLANARGIDNSTLTMSFGKLGKSFVEANRKGGSARTALNQLGITHDQTAKGAHNLSYAISVVANAFGKAKGGPERQAAALGVLGKSYKDVIPLFAEGKKGLEGQLHWADEFGSTLNGKSLKGMMAMVTAQREFKASMFGLQVQATTALLPAIHAVDDEVNTFASTLANPKLSDTQKITRIGKQFEELEDTLIGVITDALPKVAEGGGVLGVKLAGAVVKGFLNSNIWGKLVISTWIFKFLGGFGVLGKAGAKMAKTLGIKFIETLAPYFAAEAGVEGIGSALASRMPGLSTRFKGVGTRLGGKLGTGIILGLVTLGLTDSKTRNDVIHFGNAIGSWVVEGIRTIVNAGIDLINLALNKGNVFAFLGVEAPQLSHVDSLSGLIMGAGPIGGSPTGVLGQGSPDPGSWETSHHKSRHSKDHGHGSDHEAGKGQRQQKGLWRSGPPIVIHNKTYLDGKLVAENVTNHALEAAALR